MSRAALRWALSVLVCCVCCTALVLPGLAAGSAAAQETEELPVRVVLDALAPLVPLPGGQLTVAGRVLNTSDETLTNVSVRLRVSRLPLTGRGEVALIAEGKTAGRDGRALFDTRQELADLRPKTQRVFTIKVPVDDLAFGAFGAYVIGVEVRGVSSDIVGRLGIVRTFLPWVPEDSNVEQTRVSWLIPLVDVPHRLVNGVFTDDSLAESLAPTGRLGSMLETVAASGTPVTLIVDPMLLEDAAAMAGGYRVIGPGRSPVAGTGSATADAWLERLRSIASTTDVIALPYGDSDVAALQREGMTASITDAVAAGSAVAQAILDRPVRSDITLPPGSAVDQPTARTLKTAGVSTLVLSDERLPASKELTFTPTGRATLDLGSGSEAAVLLSDAALEAAVQAPTNGAGERVIARQRFLAETTMITAQRPGDARYVLIVPPRSWDVPAAVGLSLLAATRSTPWMTPSTVGEMLAQPVPDVARGPLSYPARLRARELPKGYLARVGTLAAQVGRVESILSEPARIVPPYHAMTLRLESSAWRPLERERDAAVANTASSLRRVRGQVRVLTGSVTLGSQTGTFPVTVANDLDQSVRVRLQLEAPSPRLSVTQPEPVDIGPRRKRQVLVPAHAVANGLVVVNAQLGTPAGERYSQPVEIRVRVTEYAAVGLWITIGAGAALVIMVGVRVLQRTRGRHVASQ
jgi:hypothetical protein